MIDVKQIRKFREINTKCKQEKGTSCSDLATNTLIVNSFDSQLHCQRSQNFGVG
jgi:hypothetical protein